MPFGYPDDWTEFTLDDLFDFSNGVNAEKAAYGRGVRFANVFEVIGHEALTDDKIPGRISLPPKTLGRYRVGHGDVLFNRTSETSEEVGLSSVYMGHTPIVFGGFVFRGRPKTDRLTINYSKYALRVSDVRRQIVARGQGAIRANISQRDLKTVRVVLPAVSEQETIAAVISACADLIASLGCLIAKKQEVRKALLRRLIPTAPVASGHPALGSLATFLSGGTPNRANSDYWSGTIPWISASTLKAVEVSTSDQHVTPQAVAAASKMAPVGSTLVLVRGSALHSEIRASLVAGPVCFNQDVKALVPNASVVPKFLTYAIHANTERLLRLVTSAGNTAGVLDTSVLKAFPVYLPNRDAQEGIVEILTDADAEINALKLRLDKAKAIKQGMAQQLLTGKARLPVPGVSA